jgi:hypothetical protein
VCDGCLIRKKENSGIKCWRSEGHGVGSNTVIVVSLEEGTFANNRAKCWREAKGMASDQTRVRVRVIIQRFWDSKVIEQDTHIVRVGIQRL